MPAHTRRQLLAATGGSLVALAAGCLGDNGDDESDDDELEALDDVGVYELEILDRATDDHEPIADHHDEHWHGELPTIPEGDTVSLGASVETDDGEAPDLGFDYDLEATSLEEDVITTENHEDHVHLYGEESGSAEVVFELTDDDGVAFRTVPLEATVED